MFRKVEKTLPEDPEYPTDLKELGYFINATGQIRKIAHPDEDFQFHLTNDERHNELHREAMQIFQRREIQARLAKLGIVPLYIPQLSTTKPIRQPHIPILAPPASMLKTRQRIILVVNDSMQDLGILAYRQLQRELGLNGGSVINFTKEIVKRSSPLLECWSRDDTFDLGEFTNVPQGAPGLIVTNTGQRFYSHRHNQAVSMRSWSAMPRKSLCHEAHRMHQIENTVEGNREPQEHVKYVLDHVITNRDFVSADAEVYVIGIEDGGQYLLEILDADWDKYGHIITAMALIQTGCSPAQFSSPLLKSFLHRRAREWRVSAQDQPNVCIEVPKTAHIQEGTAVLTASTDEFAPRLSPINWLQAISSSSAGLPTSISPEKLCIVDELESGKTTPGRHEDDEPLCPTFSAGETTIPECIFTDPAIYTSILGFFEEVAQDPAKYSNPKFAVNASPASDNAESELPQEVDPQQIEIEDRKAQILHMKESLAHIPEGDEILKKGKEDLEKRIMRMEEQVKEMMKVQLAKGGLKSGEGAEVRNEWKAVGGGPKVKFAGIMVDSDLLKGAGLFDSAEGEAKG
ncbi:hypothetical protein GQ43DRAFT_458355 [Delitschia confertaspora ATCC 74209]|uniref:Arb2 domain-containing protein n=1 Tax=Delitschia confertaspora ATCC 74209 TaxID=1513339 RepID=A0A9P4JJJ7_9PLEO|nr:hypothetical protein GQ43DRAFT_458355 [Delitschia confertaspora ATCC 74209]